MGGSELRCWMEILIFEDQKSNRIDQKKWVLLQLLSNWIHFWQYQFGWKNIKLKNLDWSKSDILLKTFIASSSWIYVSS